MTTSTSASDRACTPCAPAKITSCIDDPRTLSGDCSPSAHSTASVLLDLPEPLGPTITDTPGLNSSFVRSGNDLNPLRVRVLRCIYADMLPSTADAAACSASFLDRPEPRPSSSPLMTAATSNVRSWGGPDSSRTAYCTVAPRRARRSWSADL